MRIPQKLALIFIIGSSGLLFILMLLFVAQQFTGYPQVSQDMSKIRGQVDDLDNKVMNMNKNLVNLNKSLVRDEEIINAQVLM